MRRWIVLFVSLIALIIIFYLTLPNDKAKVVVCDVGQGDAILASYKNIQLLVDVGPDNKKVLKCLENHLPFWDKKIEAVILTHGDSDHIGGLNDLLRSYKIGQFFSNGLLKQDIEQKIYSQKIGQNDVVSVGLFRFEVVSPPSTGSELEDENENSVVGILTHSIDSGQGWSMFMSGDMDVETEQKLVWRGILRQGYGIPNDGVDVLKVSHHGSNTGTSDELLKVLKPKVAVISVGKNNQFGHPNDEIIKKLEDRNIEIMRTDESGEILIKL